MAETRFSETVASHYSRHIQIAPSHIKVIAGAVVTRQPNCNFLVFGLGYDTPMWVALNSSGRTLFVESSDTWITNTKAKVPGLNAWKGPFDGVTVASSLEAPLTVMAQAVVPEFLRFAKWDVILIDGPEGGLPTSPGRGLPISWASALRTPETHIFVHDYERKLETVLTDRLLRDAGPCAVIGGPTRKLFLSLIHISEPTRRT